MIYSPTPFLMATARPQNVIKIIPRPVVFVITGAANGDSSVEEKRKRTDALADVMRNERLWNEWAGSKLLDNRTLPHAARADSRCAAHCQRTETLVAPAPAARSATADSRCAAPEPQVRTVAAPAPAARSATVVASPSEGPVPPRRTSEEWTRIGRDHKADALAVAMAEEVFGLHCREQAAISRRQQAALLLQKACRRFLARPPRGTAPSAEESQDRRKDPKPRRPRKKRQEEQDDDAALAQALSENDEARAASPSEGAAAETSNKEAASAATAKEAKAEAARQAAEHLLAKRVQPAVEHEVAAAKVSAKGAADVAVAKKAKAEAVRRAAVAKKEDKALRKKIAAEKKLAGESKTVAPPTHASPPPRVLDNAGQEPLAASEDDVEIMEAQPAR